MGRDNRWHFTCSHGRQALGLEGTALPTRAHAPARIRQSAGLPRSLDFMLDVVWYTSEPTPTAEALGLDLKPSSHVLCDRLRYRYVALDDHAIVPWLEWSRERVDRRVRVALHQRLTVPGVWYVSEVPVPVRLDPIFHERTTR